MDAEFARRVADATSDGSGLAVATVIRVQGSSPGKVGFKMLVYRDLTVFGSVGGGEIERRTIAAAQKSVTEGTFVARFEMMGTKDETSGTGMICGGSAEVLIEPVQRANTLYIFGGGHVGMALSSLAKTVGFRVVVYDNRPEWANKEKHPEADEIICAPYDEAKARVQPNAAAYLVVVTHGHVNDEEVLRAFLASEHAYLGVIGSKAKARKILDQLRDEGIGDQVLKNVHLPIGLDLGGDTAAEIAVCIVAQLMAIRAGKTSVRFSLNPLREEARP